MTAPSEPPYNPWDHARDGHAFSNGTEWECWQANWCDRCLRDAPYRNGISPRGCELIAIAIIGEKIPAEWIEQDRQVLGDQYHCIEFRAPGSGGGEPRPKPTPPGQGVLLPRDGLERTRMYVQPQEVRMSIPGLPPKREPGTAPVLADPVRGHITVQDLVFLDMGNHTLDVWSYSGAKLTVQDAMALGTALVRWARGKSIACPDVYFTVPRLDQGPVERVPCLGELHSADEPHWGLSVHGRFQWADLEAEAGA